VAQPDEPWPPEPLKMLSSASLVGASVVSTEHTEIRLTIDPTGKLALWGSTNRPGGAGGWDLWISRRDDASSSWGEAQPAPFNSTANDFDPAFSPDGSELYFFSNRPGGLGGDDLYRVAVSSAGFGAVQALGPEVNSAGNEWAPALSPDGATLLFATDGRGGAGRHDLFFARRGGEGPSWLEAEAVPGELNTPEDEFDATFLADGRSLIFARSKNVDEQPISLYFAQPHDDRYPSGTPLPSMVNVEGGATLGPAQSWHDRDVLLFTGRREEASAGGLDLYEIRYRLIDVSKLTAPPGS
jgi:TolB protein